VLIVEGLDRLSRAEPLQAQAQTGQIVNAGITVVTASGSRQYRPALERNPMGLVYSLLVMTGAHKESDTQGRHEKAVIRRLCKRWMDGSYRGRIEQGHKPVRVEGNE